MKLRKETWTPPLNGGENWTTTWRVREEPTKIEVNKNCPTKACFPPDCGLGGDIQTQIVGGIKIICEAQDNFGYPDDQFRVLDESYDIPGIPKARTLYLRSCKIGKTLSFNQMLTKHRRNSNW